MTASSPVRRLQVACRLTAARTRSVHALVDAVDGARSHRARLRPRCIAAVGAPDSAQSFAQYFTHRIAQWRPSRASSRPLLRVVTIVLTIFFINGYAYTQDSVQGSGHDPASDVAQSFEQHIKPFLATYCLSCHGPEKHKGDLDLSRDAIGSAALLHPSCWKDCATKLHEREMPPEKATKQPSDAERDAFGAWVASLKRLTPKDPGKGVMRRLSQLEYANTLHDLLGVDPRIADQLPHDMVGEGYNSTISPLLMEKYLLVADAVLDTVIRPEQLTQSWKAGQLDAILDHKLDSGRPDGMERRISGPGELSAMIPAPVDGSYTIKVRASSDKVAGKEPARLAVRLDNQVVGEIKVTAPAKYPAVYTISCKLGAGKAHLSLLMANPYLEEAPAKPAAGSSAPVASKAPAKPAAGDAAPAVRTVVIDTVEVVGPPGAPPSEAQRKLFVAVPGKDLARREAAKLIAEDFARRAYRRPTQPDEIATLLKVFDLADGQDAVFSESVKLMLTAVLVSPAFLYITPDEAAPGAAGEIVSLGDHQLAARLSYLFWATMPDEELGTLADQGRLHEPATLEREVRRLLADPRAHALFLGFGAPWLWLDRLEELPVDEKKFGFMTRDLRKAMYDECGMLFDTILHEDRSIVEFVDCDYTFMNAALAKLYGMDGAVKGSALSRVHLSDANRGGVLTLPGVLAVTSLPTRTSPVKRGRWVLEQILGQNPPPPPMNVPALEKQDTEGNAGLNLRQRTERHRSDPACASCHKTLDPIGFGLENFDAVGRWRDHDDTGVAVDAEGVLPGNQAFRSPADLKHLIAARADDLCHTLVSKILAYTLCRHLDDYDEVVADEISAAVAKDGYRFQTLWLKVATSYPVLYRRIGR